MVAGFCWSKKLKLKERVCCYFQPYCPRTWYHGQIHWSWNRDIWLKLSQSFPVWNCHIHHIPGQTWHCTFRQGNCKLAVWIVWLCVNVIKFKCSLVVSLSAFLLIEVGLESVIPVSLSLGKTKAGGLQTILTVELWLENSFWWVPTSSFSLIKIVSTGLSALIGGQVENDFVFTSCLIFSIIVSNKPILSVHMPLLLRLSVLRYKIL